MCLDILIFYIIRHISERQFQFHMKSISTIYILKIIKCETLNY